MWVSCLRARRASIEAHTVSWSANYYSWLREEGAQESYDEMKNVLTNLKAEPLQLIVVILQQSSSSRFKKPWEDSYENLQTAVSYAWEKYTASKKRNHHPKWVSGKKHCDWPCEMRQVIKEYFDRRIAGIWQNCCHLSPALKIAQITAILWFCV